MACFATTPTSRSKLQSGKLWARSILAALLILAVSAGAQSAPSRYALIRLAISTGYGAARSQVNKQLTVLQSKRTGPTRRAKCRNEAAIGWLSEQEKDTASWQVDATESKKNDALLAELKSELAAQSKLQPCERRRVRRKT